MSMEPLVFVGCDIGASSNKVVLKDGDSAVSTSSLDPNPPVKKQPRQWAAWTREEEESFFTALRQVGKNFEKITCRVQSKNKDQVRHYYYRLVRRMNKLLGPELCLDAKNSKVTNAAMLRWWSLLEKYSCKASKLHLKPRRYKLFVETLENQLLRDQRKYIRRRPTQGDENSASVSLSVTSQGRSMNQDSHVVKEVPADSQKSQKPGTGKGSSVKRHTNIGINRANCKLESSAVKTARQRRKIDAGHVAGVLSAAAYKKWEKAAIAGVSLVADAAEHLERSSDKELHNVQDGHVQNGIEHVQEDMHPLATMSVYPSGDINLQASEKLKLQLFPIDEGTRRTLEKDNLNPHLELTLSARKKISSVLEHLNRKWGNSSVASGELMLFPYSAQKENLIGLPKWTKECNLNASDVCALVGSPSIFRLRYGWFSDPELGPTQLQLPMISPSSIVEGHNENINNCREQEVDLISTSKLPNQDGCVKSLKYQPLPVTKMTPSSVDSQNGMLGCFANMGSNVNILIHSDNVSPLPRTDGGLDTVMRQIDSPDDLRTHKHTTSLAGEWADSLTNISVGDLLSEVSQPVDANCISSHVPCSSHSLQQIPFSSDSFDAAIAAHIYNHQSEAAGQPVIACHASSIWGGEETCDAFTFQKSSPLAENIQGVSTSTSLGTCEQNFRPISVAADSAVQVAHGAEELLHNDPLQEDLIDESHSDSSAKDVDGLTDIYWPDSLGPLDLDIPSSRYRSEDLILSDSLGGLNRLIASSLDAFQNCSFFGLDKKESASTVEARETAAAVTDYKIGGEV